MESPAPPFTILCVDDHPITRMGIRYTLEKDNPAAQVWEAEDGETGWELYLQKHPDLVIMDLAMPRLNGLELATRIRQLHTQVGLVLITQGLDETALYRAVQLKVNSVVLKDSALDEVCACVEKVRAGGNYYSLAVQKKVAEIEQRASVDLPALEQLTDTERQVVSLIATGKTTREIAEILHNSVSTIKNHRNHICKKLNLTGGNNSLLSFAMNYRHLL